jgi:hypothetical protein
MIDCTKHNEAYCPNCRQISEEAQAAIDNLESEWKVITPRNCDGDPSCLKSDCVEISHAVFDFECEICGAVIGVVIDYYQPCGDNGYMSSIMKEIKAQ